MKKSKEQKYSHQLITGISFGLTSGVITSLGMIVGIHAATASKLAVVAGIVVMAIADGLADAVGLHVVEEAEVEKGKVIHTAKEIWQTTVFTFLSVSGFILTFVVPILLFPLKTAVFVAIAWGLLLLILLNFCIAKIRNERPLKLISEHVLLALFVVIISYLAGSLIAVWFK
jgi:VIT1/CCC1 family predicted Fe2+/Mn2+ transporter